VPLFLSAFIPHSHCPLTPLSAFVITVEAQRVGVSRPSTLLSSSMAEHSAVNRRVVGSSPTSGAINTIEISKLQKPPKRWLSSSWWSGCFGGCWVCDCSFAQTLFARSLCLTPWEAVKTINSERNEVCSPAARIYADMTIGRYKKMLRRTRHGAELPQTPVRFLRFQIATFVPPSTIAAASQRPLELIAIVPLPRPSLWQYCFPLGSQTPKPPLV
jgi:hypothetical protein